MIEKTVQSYTVLIYMAGDVAQAKQICRRHCFEVGLCVTVDPIDFIYTGGEEAGFRIGLINYPRFPASETDIWDRAVVLADQLMDGLFQHSYSLVAPDKTMWRSRREQPSSNKDR